MKVVQPIRDIEKIEQIKTYLKERSVRDWFMFVLGISLGYRISDLLLLKVKDLRNKTHITLKEGKTNKNSRVKIRQSIIDDIREYTRYLDDEDYLFPSRKSGKPIDRTQAYRILNDAGKQCGVVEIGCHSLRKTFGYHIYQKQKDVALLQNIFQHSSPAITLRYIGVNQDMMDAAIDELEI